MKFELLRDNRVKITATTKDMQTWKLSLENIARNTPDVREKFRRLLKWAKHETGFEAQEGKVMVEVRPSKNGGIVMFARNIDMIDTLDSESKPRLRKSTPIIKAYRFDTVEKLVSFAQGRDTPCSLYKYLDYYYIVFNDDGYKEVLDYATPTAVSSIMVALLEEHGELIAKDNALQIIQKFF